MKSPDQANTEDRDRNTVDQRALILGTLNGSLAKDLILGTFVVTFAVQVLGMSGGAVSAMLAIVPLIIVLRYPVLDLLRTYPKMAVLRASRWLMLACITTLIVLPTHAITLPVLVSVGVLFVLGNDFLQNAVWMNVIAEVSTHADRGRFLGRLRTWKQVTNMMFALFAFLLVGERMERGEFTVLLAIVGVLLVNSLVWYRRVPDRSAPDPIPSGKGQLRSILLRHPMLRGPLAMALIGNVIFWPTLVVFLVGHLSADADLIMLTVAATITGSIVSEWVWGVAADGFGLRRIYTIYMLGSIAVLPLLFLIPDFAQVDGRRELFGAIILLMFSFLRGVLEAGNQMAAALHRARFLDRPDGFHAINVLTAVQHLFVAGLLAIGGVLLVAGSPVAAPADGLVWHDTFRIVSAGMIASAALLGLIFVRHIRDLR